jgi:hypothetical protein
VDPVNTNSGPTKISDIVEQFVSPIIGKGGYKISELLQRGLNILASQSELTPLLMICRCQN